MNQYLKPCPFCGNESPRATHDDYIHENGQPMPVVECTNCHTWVRAESWNNRAQPARQLGGDGRDDQPEVVAWFYPNPDGSLCMDAVRDNPDYPGAVAVMTVAQHKRIVAALRQENDELRAMFRDQRAKNAALRAAQPARQVGGGEREDQQ